jgi:hypothetical protein
LKIQINKNIYSLSDEKLNREERIMSIEPESIKYHSIYMESIKELHHLHHELLIDLLQRSDTIQVEAAPENGLITPNIMYQQELLKTLKTNNDSI